MWCFEPVVGFGFVKPSKRFLDGCNRYPASARNLEAGAIWARNMPRSEHSHYFGILSAPLKKANFEPDIFVVYGAPAKMTQIMLAKNWLDGKDIAPKKEGFGLPLHLSPSTEYPLEESYIEIAN